MSSYWVIKILILCQQQSCSPKRCLPWPAGGPEAKQIPLSLQGYFVHLLPPCLDPVSTCPSFPSYLLCQALPRRHHATDQGKVRQGSALHPGVSSLLSSLCLGRCPTPASVVSPPRGRGRREWAGVSAVRYTGCGADLFSTLCTSRCKWGHGRATLSLLLSQWGLFCNYLLHFFSKSVLLVKDLVFI